MRAQILREFEAGKSTLLDFLRDDENGGTTTIEFVLWLPIFALILSLVIDVCFVFLGQAVMYDVASDAARRLAIGNKTIAEAEIFAENGATFLGAVPDVDPPVLENGAYTVVIEHNLDDLDVVGVLGFLSSDKISASVTQLREGY